MGNSILILEPEPTVRSVIMNILMRGGYEVETAADLAGALKYLKEHPVDLLITNVNVSGASGHEAGEALRSVCPDLRVLIVAGLPDNGYIQAYWSGDGFSLFPKPFTAKQLTAKVEAVLQHGVA